MRERLFAKALSCGFCSLGLYKKGETSKLLKNEIKLNTFSFQMPKQYSSDD